MYEEKKEEINEDYTEINVNQGSLLIMSSFVKHSSSSNISDDFRIACKKKFKKKIQKKKNFYTFFFFNSLFFFFFLKQVMPQYSFGEILSSKTNDPIAFSIYL